MTEDLESSTAAAWDEFERRLCEALEEMEDDDLLVLEVPSDDDVPGAAPYVQFCAWGEDRLRCEAVSNHYLLDIWALSDCGMADLVGMGFSAPTYAPDESADDGSVNFFVDGDRDESEGLALLAVQALRDVYGVPHPSLLDADGLVEPGPDEPSVPAPRDDDETSDDALEWHVPEGPDQLQEMVDAALEPMLGHPPVKDDDGDIPVGTETGAVWVRVSPNTPTVELFTTVLAGVTDRTLALHEVNVLNRDEREVKFVLRRDCITAAREVSGLPFAASRLRHAVSEMCAAVDRAHEDLSPRLRPDGDESAQ